jgi:uncharacterized protein YndB with AHSA1/START domain
MSDTQAEEGLVIVNRRRLPFARDLVFRAYAEPEWLTTWWGPKGFSSTFKRFEFRVGGSWDFVLHSPDGTDYENTKTIIEIIPDERIVYQHHSEVHGFVMTVTLTSATQDATDMEWHFVFPNDEHHRNVKAFIENANEENFDRLETCLRRMQTAT